MIINIQYDSTDKSFKIMQDEQNVTSNVSSVTFMSMDDSQEQFSFHMTQVNTEDGEMDSLVDTRAKIAQAIFGEQ